MTHFISIQDPLTIICTVLTLGIKDGVSHQKFPCAIECVCDTFKISSLYPVRWPTTVTAKELTSRQKEKSHRKKKTLTAKRKRLAAKRKTS